MNVVLDIETDSLDAQKIHCIVAKDIDTSQVHVWDYNNLDKMVTKDYIKFKKNCNKLIPNNWSVLG